MTEAVIIRRPLKLIDMTAQELQHRRLLASIWPLHPTDIFLKERRLCLFAALQYCRRHLTKPRNPPKERIKNVRVVDLQIILYFILKYRIHVPPKVGCVREAARVERPRRLLKRGGAWRPRWWRRRWFVTSLECRLCNNIIDLISHLFIGVIVKVSP